MSLDFLQNINLTKKEILLYELLLKLGEVPAGQLIKQSKLKRATAYETLYSLEEKGLVSKRKIDKVLHFKLEPPTELLNLAEKQVRIQERTKKDIQALIPQLTSSYILAVEKPVVSAFEGVKGLKEIYKDTLRVGKTIYAVLEPGAQDPELHKWLEKTYVKKRAKLEIKAKVIVSSNEYVKKDYIKRDKKELRETRIVSKDKFPFKHEVDVYADKVAFISNRKGESLIGVVIKHPSIAQTMKTWFYLAWQAASRGYLPTKK